MAKLNKYLEMLIRRNRSNGSTIKELCDSYGQNRKTILRILQKELVLPVENGLSPTSQKTKNMVLKTLKGGIKSNPYLTLEQLNMRFSHVFNAFCMNRAHINTRKFLKSLSNDNN